MNELRDVFDAAGSNIFNLFHSGGSVGFFVPAYQRDYAWDEGNILRLFEDFCAGFNTYLDHSDAITFIGTVISITDSHSEFFRDQDKSTQPTNVMILIDGQQRVTTFSLIAMALTEYIQDKLPSVNDLESDFKKSLYNLALQNIEDLESLYSLEFFKQGDINRFYPKITRAYIDKWSFVVERALYKSPVAAFTMDFIKHQKASPDFKERVEFNVRTTSLPKSSKVLSNYEAIKKIITEIFDNQTTELFIPNSQLVLESSNRDKLGLRSLPVTGFDISSLDQELKNLVRCLAFSHFLLRRVAVTHVICKNETYAFDMFESLNTTGEPLTAFETFKPKIIDSVGMNNYQESVVKSYVDEIDKDLSVYTKADDRQAATTRILSPFRAAFEGESLSKHLSEQRRFLNSAYERTPKERKNAFVKSLAIVNRFVKVCWPEKKSYDQRLFYKEFSSPNITRELELLITVLRDANHTITQGLLIRYYQKYLDGNCSELYLNELLEAVKSIVAFFIIWRSTHHGTAGIDNAYRGILKQFSLFGKDFGNAPDVSELKAHLRSQLESKIGCDKLVLSELVKKSRDLPIYSYNKTVTKFILLLSMHRTSQRGVVGERHFLVEAPTGFSEMLSKEQWDSFSTIEHVYPQKAKSDEWDESFKNENTLENSIGNLCLLPAAVNTSLGNRSWEEKLMLYSILCTESNERRLELSEAASMEGYGIPFSTKSLLTNSEYLSGLRCVSSVESWSADIVRSRSTNIYSIVYERLLSWLD